MKSTDARIRIILALLFAIRLFHITLPPIEISHNWRQTTSLMVARNFYQQEANVFYPRIDDCGDKTGIVGMEFPLLSYSIYIVSVFFGYDHWYGRLVNLIVVTIGLWFFYRLTGLYFEKRIAFFATVALAFSALFHLARKVMPDPMALSLITIGLYFGVQFLMQGKWRYLAGYFLFALAGALVKIPFGIYLALLIFPLFRSTIGITRKGAFVFLSSVILMLVYGWYFIWNTMLSEKYGLWYNSGRTWQEGWTEFFAEPFQTLERFYFNAFHGYLFFGLVLSGLILAIARRQKVLLWSVLLCIPFFVVYMIRSGYLFYHHGYYVLVMVPLMALLAGYAFALMPKRLAIGLLVLCAVESVANQQHDFFIRGKEFSKLQLTEIAASVSNPEDRVSLEADSFNPNEFYFLNRKGWLSPRAEITPSYLRALARLGCRYAFLHGDRPDLKQEFDTVFENHEYLVLRLVP